MQQLCQKHQLDGLLADCDCTRVEPEKTPEVVMHETYCCKTVTLHYTNRDSGDEIAVIAERTLKHGGEQQRIIMMARLGNDVYVLKLL